MSSLDICGRRLVNQHLVKPKHRTARDIVQFLGAVQAQDYAGAKWGIAQRSKGLTDVDVEQEINDGAILRTHLLRPTWHFVTPADIRWMLALTGSRVKAILKHYDRTLEIDEAALRRSRGVFTKVLKDGNHLTRAELAQALTKAGVRSDGTQRLARLVMHSEQDGLICSGPRRGKQFTYALLEERVPAAKHLKRDEALRELAMRYFTTRGPATTDDFAWWSGLTKADAKEGVRAAGSSLAHEVIGDRSYWFPPARSAKIESPFVRLLSNYDEYFIGHKDRSAIHAHLRSSGVKRIPSALFGHILTIDGQVVGEWERAITAKSAVVRVKPLTPLSKTAHRAIAAEVSRFSKFLETPVALRIG